LNNSITSRQRSFSAEVGGTVQLCQIFHVLNCKVGRRKHLKLTFKESYHDPWTFSCKVCKAAIQSMW
jgi:hypothetical protein